MQCHRAGAEGEEMTKPPNIKADVESWIASESTDKVADYASRGRKHQNLSDLDLVTAWQTAFKRMADDVRDYDRRAVEEDYKSEFILRKIEPPYASIHDELERYFDETDRAIRQLQTDDPKGYEKMGRTISTDLEAFKLSRDKSKN